MQDKFLSEPYLGLAFDKNKNYLKRIIQIQIYQSLSHNKMCIRLSKYTINECYKTLRKLLNLQ